MGQCIKHNKKIQFCIECIKAAKKEAYERGYNDGYIHGREEGSKEMSKYEIDEVMKNRWRY